MFLPIFLGTITQAQALRLSRIALYLALSVLSSRTVSHSLLIKKASKQHDGMTTMLHCVDGVCGLFHCMDDGCFEAEM